MKTLRHCDAAMLLRIWEDSMLSFMEFLATSLQHVISVVTAFFRPDRHTDVQYVAIPQSRRRIDLGLITSAN